MDPCGLNARMTNPPLTLPHLHHPLSAGPRRHVAWMGSVQVAILVFQAASIVVGRLDSGGGWQLKECADALDAGCCFNVPSRQRAAGLAALDEVIDQTKVGVLSIAIPRLDPLDCLHDMSGRRRGRTANVGLPVSDACLGVITTASR
ncbi:hypothetical protein TgHK011_000526 [Trichoderma gracile]|nr:hypothetical protein TgHK011_000526 [Trichoderma gracile]